MRLLWSLIIFAAMPLAAQETLVNGNPKMHWDYQAFVIANPRYQSYVDEILTSPSQRLNWLEHHYKEAKLAFLEGQKHKAFTHFYKIVTRAHSDDWSEEHSSLISDSFYYLARLNIERKNHWIEQGIFWDWKNPPNPKIFPPDLLKNHKRIFNDLSWVEWQPPVKNKDFQQILINGRANEVIPHLTLPLPEMGRVRITWLSNTWAPISQVIAVKNIQTLSLLKRPLAGGDCDRPQFFRTEPRHLVYFSDHCLRKVKKLNLVTLSEKSTPVDSPTVAIHSQPIPPAKTWWQRNWKKLTVIGVVVAGIKFKRKKKKERRSEPSSTYHDGF